MIQKFYISNYLKVTNPTTELWSFVRRHFVVDNPDYINRLRLGKYAGFLSKTLSLYEITKDCKLLLPFGATTLIPSNLIKGVATRDEQLITRPNAAGYNPSNLQLRDYQKEAVSSLDIKHTGVLVAPTGAGKTNIALGLIERLNLPTLWLSHRVTLVEQAYNRALALGFNKSQLQKGIKKGFKGITFATVHSLYHSNLDELKYNWGLIIVDECHNAAINSVDGTMYQKVLNNLACLRKIGLTATPMRTDNLFTTTTCLIGKVQHTIKIDDIKIFIKETDKDGNKKEVELPPPKKTVLAVTTNIKIPPDGSFDGAGMINGTKLINKLTEDSERNEIIVNCVRAVPSLVLSDRVNHLEELKKLIEEKHGEGTAVIIKAGTNTEKARAKREEELEKVRRGGYLFLLATYSLAKEGIDIPNLIDLHLTTPHNSEQLLIQSIGRVTRIMPNKTDVLIYDYIDPLLYKKYIRYRRPIYKKLGCEFKGV